MNELNSNTSLLLSTSEDYSLPRLAKFYLFVVLEPPAIICNTLLVFYLLFDRNLRLTLHYHGLLALLITSLLNNLVEVPRIIHYLHSGVVTIQSMINCIIWQCCDYLMFSMINVLMLWTSIERHLLIFNSQLYSTSKHRLYLHYGPLVVVIIYMCLFYIGAVLIYPCEPQLDFTQPLCGYPCYTGYSNISVYDLLAHGWIPLCCSVLFDIGFVLRTIYRRRVGIREPAVQWRKHRKMMFQLLVISSLCSACQIPFVSLLFVQLFTQLPDMVLYIQTTYFYYLFWFLTMILPFACLGCLPEVINRMKKMLLRKFTRKNRITMLHTSRFPNKTASRM